MFQKLSKSEAAMSYPPGGVVKKGTPASEWRQKSRFLIYLHSKMAITDDARIVIGSANFNERSLSGCRDTEANIAASQVFNSC